MHWPVLNRFNKTWIAQLYWDGTGRINKFLDKLSNDQSRFASNFYTWAVGLQNNDYNTITLNTSLDTQLHVVNIWDKD